MASYSEYNGIGIGKGCSYVSLGTYNQQMYGRGFGAPIPSTTKSFIVPSFGMAGYGNLQHGCLAGTCTGYYSMKGAYPDYQNNCCKFTSRLCS